MSWLGALDVAGFAFRSLLGEASNPNKVLDVKSGQYSNRFIHCREEALVLYGPSKEGLRKQEKYEIVLQRPCSESLHQAFSLFRSNELVEAEVRFLQLKDKIPLLVEISREVCNLGGIQKLCDALQENPTWTVAHLASSFALHGAFQHPDVLSHLNSPDMNTGVTPLQVAIKTGNLRTIQALLSAKASLEYLDNEVNSVFHYAASTTKEIISALTAESSKCLNYQNAAGYTPLHLACRADKPECVKALIIAGADVNIAASQTSVDSSSSTTPSSCLGDFVHENTKKLHAEDMKFGGTPLHWSCSRQVIETLVDMECDINSRNFDGRTALHIMVLRKRLECVVALLSRNADISIGDDDGNTPLHLAVTQGSAAIVQALVIFGADLSYKNNAGATPRHGIQPESGGDKILYILHSVGAPRCSPDMQGCTRGCEGSSDDFNGVPPPVPPSSESREIVAQMLSVVGMDIATTSVLAGNKSTKGGRLLCLDGGGIRGLVLVVILLELEKELGCPVIHCFDWVAGTSTGGILTLGLAAGFVSSVEQLKAACQNLRRKCRSITLAVCRTLVLIIDWCTRNSAYHISL